MQEIENHLMKALRQPADKLSASREWFPTGRYISDYVQSLKFLNTFRIIGFTLNLEHSYGAKPLSISMLITNRNQLAAGGARNSSCESGMELQ